MRIIPENIVLENDFVQLRLLHETDFNQFRLFALNEPEIWEYSVTPVAGEANMKHYIHEAVKGWREGHSFPFIVFDKVQDSYAGSTRFYDIQPTHKTLQLGYTWYGKNFQGTGLNKQCKFLLLEFAFEKLGMERVEFRANAKNQRSIAAMKSIGCVEEGILRSCIAEHGGTRRDSIILSILKDEWYGGVKEKLAAKLILPQ